MNKKYIYIIAVVVLLAATAGIIYNYQHKKEEEENRVYTLLPRKGAAAQSAEWKDVQKRAKDLLAALKEDPNDMNSSIRLAALYIQEARETGNYVYYDQAAMKYVSNILSKDTANFNALVYKSLIYLSQHHFADGLAAAQKAQRVNPYNSYVYGLMVDSYVELGNYDSAVANADRMVALRPDLTSYSRVSYLREIFGNYPAAIDAMKLAAEAGGRGDEHTEWTRVQLGSLYEKVGDYKSADSLYNISLSLRPDYPYALAGMGRVAMARNDYKLAATYFEKADSLVNDNTIKEDLVDVYKMMGQTKRSTDLAESVIDDLSKTSQAGNNDQAIGHYADRELAYDYLKVNNTDKALEHAMLEYNRRPDNIDVNETVAWVYYNKGEYDKAVPYIKAALRTNSKNPVLLSRAGLIYFKNGQKELAKTMLQAGSATNSYLGSPLKTDAAAAMQSL